MSLTSERSFIPFAHQAAMGTMTGTAGAADRSGAVPPRAVLEVAGLGVRLPTEDGEVHPVRGVDFALAPGEVL